MTTELTKNKILTFVDALHSETWAFVKKKIWKTAKR